MRPIAILYILAFYVLLQFTWWAYLLIELNDEVYEHKIENVRLKAAPVSDSTNEVRLLENKIRDRRRMVYGEGGVFLAVLIWGTVKMLQSMRKEMMLARLQKNFLLSVTHEFKSPLASIKLYLQTILKHDLEREKISSFINNAISDTERLNNLVENALLANLIDHKGYSFSKEDVNLSALIRLFIQRLQAIPDYPKIDARIEDGIIFNADKNAFYILFYNLIENAAKYSPQGSAIKVELTRTGIKTDLRISNLGPKIPDSEKKRIFKKFYRMGNEETRKTKGTGLGLFIVKYITERHNGIVYVKDNEPQGSIFCIEFKS